MSTMNSEIYAALIDAGSSEEKAKVAAISVTGYEQDIYKVKPDLKLIKCHSGFMYLSLKIVIFRASCKITALPYR